MKIAILYIATGDYSIFWKDFYTSSEIFFIPNIPKHYFVFTDSQDIRSSEDVSVIFKKCEGFPKDSLFRFQMFLTIKDRLKSFDYIYFFNSNMMFLGFVGDEFLPKNNLQENGLIGVLHPGHSDKNYLWYPYDRNAESKAFIPFVRNKKYSYFMGGVNGGLSVDYLRLIEACTINIEKDLKFGYIAIYHDESHLNRYFFENNCKILPSEYGWIEGKKSDKPIKILIRDKTRFSSMFRKQSTNILIRFLNIVKHFIHAVKWVTKKYH